METLSENISASPPEEGNAQGRFFFIKAALLTTSVLSLETRLLQSGTDVPNRFGAINSFTHFPQFALIKA